MTLRIALVAEESAGIRLLRALQRMPHELVAVVAGTGGDSGVATVAALASDMGLPVVDAAAIDSPELPRTLRARKCDLLLNAHSLRIIPEAVLEVPRLGCYNLHPGPLPEMAGLNVPSWAVFLEHREHAATVHRMDPGIDTGPVVSSESFGIGESDTGFSVMARCIQAGVPQMLDLVDRAAAGQPIPTRPQDLARRTYYAGRPPNDGWIDWTWTPSRIEAFARACDYGPFPSPWGRPRFTFGSEVILVRNAEPAMKAVKSEPGTVVAATTDRAEVAVRGGTVELYGLRREDDHSTEGAGGVNIPPGTQLTVRPARVGQ